MSSAQQRKDLTMYWRILDTLLEQGATIIEQKPLKTTSNGLKIKNLEKEREYTRPDFVRDHPLGTYAVHHMYVSSIIHIC